MKKAPTPRARFLVVLCLSLSVGLTGCGSSQDRFVTIATSRGDRLKIHVEIAETQEQREKGLMFRQSLPEGTGMLFFFPAVTRESFWMKNTPITLDMIFIRGTTIVSLIERAAPYSETILTPDHDYDRVLEVPGGYAKNHGIRVGDSLQIP